MWGKRCYRFVKVILWAIATVLLLTGSDYYAQPAGKGYIPVLMYHHFTEEAALPGDQITISKDEFEAHLQYFSDNGYTTLFLDELYKIMTAKDPLPQKHVVITIDDGYASNYEIAYPLLEQYGMKANISVIISHMNKEFEIPTLTTKQMIEMEDSGYIKFYNHGYTHDKHSAMEEYEIRNGCEKSEIFLNTLLKQCDFKVFTYPYGDHNTKTTKLLKQLGYKMQLLTTPGVVKKSTQAEKIPRIRIVSGVSVEEMMSAIAADYK